MGKKSWIKPELIVLVRNKPEEAVLALCKGGEGIVSNAGIFDACSRNVGYCNILCSERGVS
jgi:hypothetical protein